MNSHNTQRTNTRTCKPQTAIISYHSSTISQFNGSTTTIQQHINHARSYIQQQQNPTQQHNAPPGDKIRTISVLVRRSLLTRPCVMRDFFLGCRRSFFFSFSLVLPRIELALLGMSLTTLGVTQTSSPPLEYS